MNRESTAGFVPLAMYIVFRQFVLLNFRLFVLLRLSFFYALKGTIYACILSEMCCRRLVLLSVAPPRHAPRPDPPVVYPGCGLDLDSTY